MTMKKNKIFDIIKTGLLTIVLFANLIILSGCSSDLIKYLFEGDPTKVDPNYLVKKIEDISYNAMLFAGIIGAIFFIYGGILYITSFGNQDGMEKGKKTITWAIIGIAVIMLARTVFLWLLSNIMK